MLPSIDSVAAKLKAFFKIVMDSLTSVFTASRKMMSDFVDSVCTMTKTTLNNCRPRSSRRVILQHHGDDIIATFDNVLFVLSHSDSPFDSEWIEYGAHRIKRDTLSYFFEQNRKFVKLRAHDPSCEYRTYSVDFGEVHVDKHGFYRTEPNLSDTHEKDKECASSHSSSSDDEADAHVPAARLGVFAEGPQGPQALDEVERLVEGFVQNHEETPRARYVRALARFKRGDFEAALAELRGRDPSRWVRVIREALAAADEDASAAISAANLAQLKADALERFAAIRKTLKAVAVKAPFFGDRRSGRVVIAVERVPRRTVFRGPVRLAISQRANFGRELVLLFLQFVDVHRITLWYADDFQTRTATGQRKSW